MPIDIKKQPIMLAAINLFFLPNQFVKNVPIKEPENCAMKKFPDCWSFKFNLCERNGKTCPIKTVAIPERKNPT